MPRATTAAWLVMPPRLVTMPLRGVHAVNIFGAGFDAAQNDFLPLSRQRFGFIGAEHDFARSGARRSRQTFDNNLLLGFRIKRRMQQLIERCRIDAFDRFALCRSRLH